MPGQKRFRIPGIPQHVIQRGNDRQACFFDCSDYQSYLSLLDEAAARHRCEVHAYVLMTNHVHLLATPRVPDGISRMMQAIGRRYVQQINALYGRTGTLWGGRYKATVVGSDPLNSSSFGHSCFDKAADKERAVVRIGNR